MYPDRGQSSVPPYPILCEILYHNLDTVFQSTLSHLMGKETFDSWILLVYNMGTTECELIRCDIGQQTHQGVTLENRAGEKQTMPDNGQAR